MSSATHGARKRVLLAAAPWPLFNRPSLPLGALKAYLAASVPHVPVDTCHLFLRVAHALGYERYQRISRRVWRAEAVFAALLYPERAHVAQSLYRSTLKGSRRSSEDFGLLVRQVEAAVTDWLAEVDWDALQLLGVTISFCQVTASLYLIARAKALHPSLPVVVGGSSFAGETSAELLSVFPQIDYLVVGEGERPLAALIRWLDGDAERSAPGLPDGVLSRDASPAQKAPMSQLERLDALPPPDYDDYFAQIAGFAARDRFFATVPIEASRGCYWQRQAGKAGFGGCAFCNLNLQWRGYRSKPPQRVVAEVDHLAQRYQVLSLAFADNAFPIRHAEAIFDGIRELTGDFAMFTELRANTSAAVLGKMKRAGVDTVQVGIEALSSRLLAKMNKGVRAIDNLSVMKHCEAVGIVNASNLMLHFPGSDAADIDETLSALTFAQWYRPLKTVGFWLGLDSPVCRCAPHFGVQAVFNHPNVKKLFPETVAGRMRFMIQGYRGDRQRQLGLWRPVVRAVRRWEKTYAALQRKTGGRPALSYRDGGRFLIVDQYLVDQPTARHRFTGVSADIYRYCHTPRRLDQVTAAFGDHRSQQIAAFLRGLVDKRLMFAEEDTFLSLAPRVGSACPK